MLLVAREACRSTAPDWDSAAVVGSNTCVIWNALIGCPALGQYRLGQRATILTWSGDSVNAKANNQLKEFSTTQVV